MVVVLLLTYRYLILLLQEGSRMSAAYALRAPYSKGIAFNAWGTLVGQLLLRSIDRAQTVYESMHCVALTVRFICSVRRTVRGRWHLCC